MSPSANSPALWARVPLWLIESDVSDRAIRLYAVLSGKYADRETGQSYPSRRTLARDLKLSRTSRNIVDKAVAELEKVGALKKQVRASADGERRSNLYTVYFHRDGDDADQPQGSGRAATTLVAEDHHRVDVNQHHRNQNQTNQKYRRTRRTRRLVSDAPTYDAQLIEDLRQQRQAHQEGEAEREREVNAALKTLNPPTLEMLNRAAERDIGRWRASMDPAEYKAAIGRRVVHIVMESSRGRRLADALNTLERDLAAYGADSKPAPPDDLKGVYQ